MALTARAVDTAYQPGVSAGADLTVLPENKNIQRPQPKKTPYFKYLALSVCVFAALMSVLLSYDKVNTLTTETAQLEATLAELKSDGNALNAKKEQRFNLAYVEEVAVGKLGMVKLDKSQITYVAIANPEKITTAHAEIENGEVKEASGLVAGILRSFNAVVEYLN